MIPSFLDAAILTSEVFGISDDPNSVCLQDRLVYTCTGPIVLSWTVGGIQIGSYVSGQASAVVGATRTNGALPGVEANLTDVNGTTLTSTLTIPSAGSVTNGSVILCEGLSGDSDSTVLRHRGEIPGCCMWARSRIVGWACNVSCVIGSVICCWLHGPHYVDNGKMYEQPIFGAGGQNLVCHMHAYY